MRPEAWSHAAGALSQAKLPYRAVDSRRAALVPQRPYCRKRPPRRHRPSTTTSTFHNSCPLWAVTRVSWSGPYPWPLASNLAARLSWSPRNRTGLVSTKMYSVQNRPLSSSPGIPLRKPVPLGLWRGNMPPPSYRHYATGQVSLQLRGTTLRQR